MGVALQKKALQHHIIIRIMDLNLSGIDTKTFTGHSTRTTSSSKPREAGVPTGEVIKRGFWSKESTFGKFYHKEINTEDPHFHLSI